MSSWSRGISVSPLSTERVVDIRGPLRSAGLRRRPVRLLAVRLIAVHLSPRLPALGRILERDGLIQIGTEGVRLTPAGRILMRAVAMTFDAYLRQARAGDVTGGVKGCIP